MNGNRTDRVASLVGAQIRSELWRETVRDIVRLEVAVENAIASADMVLAAYDKQFPALDPSAK